MSEPRYRFVEPALPFVSLFTYRENQQLPQRRFDEQPPRQAEQHRAPTPSKTVKVNTPDTTTRTPAPRPVSGKTNPPPLLDREREQLFEQFLEWRSHQKDIP
jgi:hypothetical protein